MTRHVFQCPLRWSDVDVYGIVNNVAFLRLLEEARVDFIMRLGSTNGDAFFKGGSVVVKHRIEYKQPLCHRHAPVDIELWVTDLAAAEVTVDYEIKDGDRVYAIASTVMAPYDYTIRRPRRLTDRESDFFRLYLELRAPTTDR